MRLPSRAGLQRRAGAVLEAFDERLPHGRRVFRYRDFDVVYRRRGSLVERIEKWGGYEEETVAAIGAELAASEGKTLVDVGANIGLVSLAVLAAVPEANVFAFEPGPDQHGLLAETIRRNGLGNRIALSPLALSDAPG